MTTRYTFCILLIFYDNNCTQENSVWKLNYFPNFSYAFHSSFLLSFFPSFYHSFLRLFIHYLLTHLFNMFNILASQSRSSLSERQRTHLCFRTTFIYTNLGPYTCIIYKITSNQKLPYDDYISWQYNVFPKEFQCSSSMQQQSCIVGCNTLAGSRLNHGSLNVPRLSVQTRN